MADAAGKDSADDPAGEAMSYRPVLVRMLLLLAIAACVWFLVTAPASIGSSPAGPTSEPQPAAVVFDAVVNSEDRLDPSTARVLDEIRARDTGQLAVSEEDGRFLRVLVAARGTRRALEIGTASGYSAIWLGLGLVETGGRLVTIELDSERAAEAVDHVRRAGLSATIEVIAGNAFEEIPRLEGDFDFVFLDAWKPDYQRFFEMVFPRLQPGGLFVAHNVINKQDEMPDFLQTIRTHPALWTTIVSPSHEGMSVSYRMR